MTGHFRILLGLSCLLLSCEGKIYPPSNGTSLIFAPGSTARIAWSFDDVIQWFSYRIWTFILSDGKLEGLASIRGDGDFKIYNSSFDVAVEKPATLVLKNVNQSYNGSYVFNLQPVNGKGTSIVAVFIAEKPTVTVSCSSPITVNEGGNVTCACKGQSGNPPADVTWYNDNVRIDESGKEEKTLNLSNVDKTASGTYKCVAQSHTLTDEKSIEIIVYYAVPPTVISLTSTPENAVFGESVVITCEAIAVPLPSYIIIHNDTEVVSTHKTYIITVLKYSDCGSYKCIAKSILGNSSKTFGLSVLATRTTNVPNTKKFGTEKTALEESTCSGTEWYIIVLSLVSGIIIGLFLAYMLLCAHRRWFRNRKHKGDPEPQTTAVDTTYQELDLSKMNAEENYQSLRMNAANIKTENDDYSTYTELNKGARDDENNYQSLT